MAEQHSQVMVVQAKKASLLPGIFNALGKLDQGGALCGLAIELEVRMQLSITVTQGLQASPATEHQSDGHQYEDGVYLASYRSESGNSGAADERRLRWVLMFTS